MSKDQAMIQFKADQERATAEKVRQTKTLEYAQSQLEANGLGAYGEAISQIMDSNPNCSFLRYTIMATGQDCSNTLSRT